MFYSLFATKAHVAIVLRLILATVAVQGHRFRCCLLELRNDLVEDFNGLRYVIQGDGLQRLQLQLIIAAKN